MQGSPATASGNRCRARIHPTTETSVPSGCCSICARSSIATPIAGVLARTMPAIFALRRRMIMRRTGQTSARPAIMPYTLVIIMPILNTIMTVTKQMNHSRPNDDHDIQPAMVMRNRWGAVSQTAAGSSRSGVKRCSGLRASCVIPHHCDTKRRTEIDRIGKRERAVRIVAIAIVGECSRERAVARELVSRRIDAAFELVHAKTMRGAQRARVRDELLGRAHLALS